MDDVRLFSKALSETEVGQLSTGFTVSNGSLVLSQNSDQSSFKVQLSSAPVNDVVLNLSSSNTTLVSSNVQSLTFNASNWSIGQDVELTRTGDGAEDTVESP